SVPKYRRLNLVLTLRELRRLARLVQPRLLALDDTSVAREKACTLERDTQLGVGLHESARDAVADGAGLATGTASVHTHADVVGAFDSCDLQRRQCGRSMRLAWEVLLDG